MWYFVWLLLPHFDGLPIVLDGRDCIFDFMAKLWQDQKKIDRSILKKQEAGHNQANAASAATTTTTSSSTTIPIKRPRITMPAAVATSQEGEKQDEHREEAERQEERDETQPTADVPDVPAALRPHRVQHGGGTGGYQITDS